MGGSERKKVEAVTRLQVLNTIYDDISISMVELIQNNSETADSLIDKLNLTHKQYYDRIMKFRKTSIVTRKNGAHVLTSFGIIVASSCKKINKALEYRWKLRIIDSINLSDNITAQERSKLIDYLLDDLEIKKIVLKQQIK